MALATPEERRHVYEPEGKEQSRREMTRSGAGPQERRARKSHRGISHFHRDGSAPVGGHGPDDCGARFAHNVRADDPRVDVRQPFAERFPVMFKLFLKFQPRHF